MLTYVLADIINASPDSSDVPGAPQLQQLLGGAMWMAVAGCVVAIIMGAVALGLGNHSGNPHWAERGRFAVIGGIVGGFLIGAASAIVQFAFGIGSHVSGG